MLGIQREGRGRCGVSEAIKCRTCGVDCTHDNYTYPGRYALFCRRCFLRLRIPEDEKYLAKLKAELTDLDAKEGAT